MPSGDFPAPCRRSAPPCTATYTTAFGAAAARHHNPSTLPSAATATAASGTSAASGASAAPDTAAALGAPCGSAAAAAALGATAAVPAARRAWLPVRLLLLHLHRLIVVIRVRLVARLHVRQCARARRGGVPARC